MTDPEIYPITGNWTNASLNAKTYAELYEAAASNPGGFWLDQATKRLDWTRAPTIAVYARTCYSRVSWNLVTTRWSRRRFPRESCAPSECSSS